jgi:hypothetical protein
MTKIERQGLPQFATTTATKIWLDIMKRSREKLIRESGWDHAAALPVGTFVLCGTRLNWSIARVGFDVGPGFAPSAKLTSLRDLTWTLFDREYREKYAPVEPWDSVFYDFKSDADLADFIKAAYKVEGRFRDWSNIW